MTLIDVLIACVTAAAATRLIEHTHIDPARGLAAAVVIAWSLFLLWCAAPY